MIVQGESSLSPDQYALIQAGNLPAAFSVVAHQYNPKFELLETNTTATLNNTTNFAIFRASPYIFRYNSGLLERFDTASEEWALLSAFNFIDLPPLENTPPAFTRRPDGSIHVFICTHLGLYTNVSTDLGDTWSGWSQPADLLALGQFAPTYSFQESKSDQATWSASSTYNGDTVNYGPQLVADDDGVETFWAANAVATLAAPQWLKAVFPDPQYVTRYVVRAASDRSLPRAISMEGSNDGVTWQSMFSMSPISHNSSGYGTAWMPNESRAGGVVNSVWATPYTQFRFLIADEVATSLPPAIRDLKIQVAAQTSRGQIHWISAVTWNRIHYVYWDETKDVWNLRVMTYNDATDLWESTSSDIYWPYPLTSFQAAPSTEDIDVIVITSETPGTLSIVNEDNHPAKYLEENGGIMMFSYRYGQWSDHNEIDIVEGVKDWRYRRNARVTRINGRLYITAHSSEGTKDFPVKSYRCYRSALDGEFWSMNNLMPLPEQAGESGVALALEGEYIYAFEAANVYRAPSTQFFGYSSINTQVDITGELREYECTQATIFQSGLRLSNSTGWLDNHPILNGQNTVVLVHSAGVWVEVEGQFEKLMVVIGRTLVEAMEYEETINDRTVRLTSRDLSARMTDYVKSENARYWKSQAVGLDQFKDNSGTNYGGLSHTATESGSHKTVNGYLEAKTNVTDPYTVAFSTFESDIWNGVIQTGFVVPALVAADAGIGWAGVVFRSPDSDTKQYVTYIHSLDKVVYGIGSGYVGAISSPVLGWSSTPGVGRYIRVEFRYGQMKVFTSSDSGVGVRDGGKVWTLQFTHIFDLRFQRLYEGLGIRRITYLPWHSGYVGTIGWGYSS